MSDFPDRKSTFPVGTVKKGLAVTKSDSQVAEGIATYPIPAEAIWVGTGGDVAVLQPDGVALIYYGVPSGSFLSVNCARVNSTGTSASQMNAVWF